jgi:hypothetical protein
VKRYILFAGHSHYPEGGVADIEAIDDSVEKCLSRITTYLSVTSKGPRWTLRRIRRPGYGQGDEITWWHVLDLTTMAVVAADADSAAAITEWPEWSCSDKKPDAELSLDDLGRLPGLYRGRLFGFITLAPDALVLSLSEADRQTLEKFNETSGWQHDMNQLAPASGTQSA